MIDLVDLPFAFVFVSARSAAFEAVRVTLPTPYEVSVLS
jgi:hypothetical protein